MYHIVNKIAIILKVEIKLLSGDFLLILKDCPCGIIQVHGHIWFKMWIYVAISIH